MNELMMDKIQNIDRATLQYKELKQCQSRLKQEVQELSLKTESIHQLEEENVELRKDLETLKRKLCSLQSSNIIQQIVYSKEPSEPQKTTETKSIEPPAENVSKSEGKTKEQPNRTQKQGKKEKKKEDGPKKEPEPDAPADISRLDLRVGKIVEVSRHPDADSLYVEKIDVGEDQPRTVISGLVKFVPIDEMLNRMVILFCNLKPAKMRGITSEGMVMCASTPEKVEILTPPKGSQPGDLVSCEGYERKPDSVLNPKKKIWETVAPHLKTNGSLVATYKENALFVEGKGHIVAQTLDNVQVK